MADTQPTERLTIVSLVVPPNTPIASPAVVPVTPQPGFYVIQRLEVVIPYGVAGLAGFALTSQGEWLCPWKQTNTYVIGDDEVAKIPIDFETSGSLNIQGINSDVWQHIFTVRLWYSDVNSGVPNSLNPTPMVPLSF